MIAKNSIEAALLRNRLLEEIGHLNKLYGEVHPDVIERLELSVSEEDYNKLLDVAKIIFSFESNIKLLTTTVNYSAITINPANKDKIVDYLVTSLPAIYLLFDYNMDSVESHIALAFMQNNIVTFNMDDFENINNNILVKENKDGIFIFYSPNNKGE